MPAENDAHSEDDLQRLSVKQPRNFVHARAIDCFDVAGKDEPMLREMEALDAAKLSLTPEPPREPTLLSDLGTTCEATVLQEDRSSEAQRSRVVRLPRFISEEEIAVIHKVAASHRDICRNVASATSSYRTGAWDTLYLQANDIFDECLPRLKEKLLDAARQADAAQGWNLLQAAQRVTLRVCEYHTVTTHGSLPWARHFDSGSLATIDCMLSTPDVDFEGGIFQTLEPDGELMAHTFQRGDVQIFQSHKFHCVSPVAAGTRHVLVIELWDGEARRCAHRCELRVGPCPHEQPRA